MGGGGDGEVVGDGKLGWGGGDGGDVGGGIRGGGGGMGDVLRRATPIGGSRVANPLLGLPAVNWV